MTLKEKLFQDIVERGENAGDQYFLLSHNVFYHIKDVNHHLSYIYYVIRKCFQFGQVHNVVVW